MSRTQTKRGRGIAPPQHNVRIREPYGSPRGGDRRHPNATVPALAGTHQWRRRRLPRRFWSCNSHRYSGHTGIRTLGHSNRTCRGCRPHRKPVRRRSQSLDRSTRSCRCREDRMTATGRRIPGTSRSGQLRTHRASYRRPARNSNRSVPVHRRFFSISVHRMPPGSTDPRPACRRETRREATSGWQTGWESEGWLQKDRLDGAMADGFTVERPIRRVNSL